MTSVLEELSGGILLVDGLGSILYSTDQRRASNIGRVVRMVIGELLIIDGVRRQ